MATTVTKTIRSSGGDYTTLSAWEAAQQGDLVTADEIRVAECYNDWSGGLDERVTISGSTTDSTRYRKITVASGNDHAGSITGGFYLKFTSTPEGGIGIVNLSEPNFILEKVRIESGVTASVLSGIGGGSVSNILIDRVIVKVDAATESYGFTLSPGTGHSIKIRSSLVYGSKGGVVFFPSGTGSAEVLNCVAGNCSYGFYTSAAAGGIILKNCVQYNCTALTYSGTFSASSTHNATSTGSDDAPGASSVISVASGAFVDAANNNFHLASGSALIGAGTNLYSTFTTDIDGDTWPSSGAWDIGFDYRVSAATAKAFPFTRSAQRFQHMMVR